MSEETYSRAIIIWTDDNLQGRPLPENPWVEIMGVHSDRIFRLMDVSLEICTSYHEALEVLEKASKLQHDGAFIYGVVDLILPPNDNAPAEMKFGVLLAEEFRKRGFPFAFLSANSGATNVLDQAGLGTTPYHVKSLGNAWKFPDSLIMQVLSEIRRNVSWISLKETVALNHEHSDIHSFFSVDPETFSFFPFFGPFREFVERCEYRGSSQFHKAFAIRSPRKHCDEFVLQCLAIMLYQFFLDNPGQTIVRYGHAHDVKFLNNLNHADFRENSHGIAVIRVLPSQTSIDALRDLISAAKAHTGKYIFVLPNDETVDQYIDILREYRVMAVEELPQMSFGDSAQREELIRRTSVLAMQQWLQPHFLENSPNQNRILVTNPELLINPIDWTILCETYDVAEALSDPYEIVKEFIHVLWDMKPMQNEQIQHSLSTMTPIPYSEMLRVGHQTFLSSEYEAKLSGWIERTLDNWLKTSWQFPYGLRDAFTEVERLGQIHLWQDWCYEVLVGILKEYQRCGINESTPSSLQSDIQRVAQFLETLGDEEFLIADEEEVNWEILELMRWPHRAYPMPTTVLRRLRQAGRYLWIQPEGLDIATALPAGRLRYRMLGSIVDQYWSVLVRCNQVVQDLPRGWRDSVEYLVTIIVENRVRAAWEEEADKVWWALLGLLRNAAPIMFITDQIVRGKPLVGKKSAAEFLQSVQGYGAILSRLRATRNTRIGGYLATDFHSTAKRQDIDKLRRILTCFDVISGELGDQAHSRLRELESSAAEFIRVLCNGSDSSCLSDTTCEENTEIKLGSRITQFLANPDYGLTASKEWFVDGLDQSISNYYQYGDVPSLLGTKADYLWQVIDALMYVENLTYRYRYYDGYHFLACINDLRVYGKDTNRPDVEVSVIENLLDLFISSIDSILAQLAWCVKLAGEIDLANALRPSCVQVVPSEGFIPPSKDELSNVLRVTKSKNSWAIYTLGIPGKGAVNKLCFHEGRVVRKIK